MLITPHINFNKNTRKSCKGTQKHTSKSQGKTFKCHGRFWTFIILTAQNFRFCLKNTIKTHLRNRKSQDTHVRIKIHLNCFRGVTHTSRWTMFVLKSQLLYFRNFKDIRNSKLEEIKNTTQYKKHN